MDKTVARWADVVGFQIQRLFPHVLIDGKPLELLKPARCCIRANTMVRSTCFIVWLVSSAALLACWWKGEVIHVLTSISSHKAFQKRLVNFTSRPEMML